jgi:hypothetical protein
MFSSVCIFLFTFSLVVHLVSGITLSNVMASASRLQQSLTNVWKQQPSQRTDTELKTGIAKLYDEVC